MNSRISIIIAAAALLQPFALGAQDSGGGKPPVWDLEGCIGYALENNISIKMQDLNLQSAEASLEQTKAAKLPTLNMSAGGTAMFQNIPTYNDYMEASDNGTLSGNLGLSSGVVLYQGGKLRKTVEQSELGVESAGQQKEQALLETEVSVTQAYIQILYDKENLEVCRTNEQLDKELLERGDALLSAGSISMADHAQLKSQYASDKYNTVAAENTLNADLLKLRQLLELGLDDEFDPVFPEVGDEQVYEMLPDLAQIYAEALETLPQMRSSSLEVESSELDVEIAKAGALPSLSLNAGLSTGMYSSTETSAIQQISDKLAESVGLSLNIPIFNGKQNVTNIKKAKIQHSNALLQEQSTKKEILSSVQNLYNDAVAARQKYEASKEKLAASEQSYELVKAQFTAGVKNVVDLNTEKASYISALSGQLQAKYQALLANKILKRYTGIPIEL